MSDKALTPFSVLAISGNTHLMQDFICMYTHIIEIYAQKSAQLYTYYTQLYTNILHLYMYMSLKRESQQMDGLNKDSGCDGK